MGQVSHCNLSPLCHCNLSPLCHCNLSPLCHCNLSADFPFFLEPFVNRHLALK